MKFVLTILLLASCGKRGVEPKDIHSEKIEALRAKYETVKSKFSGWPSTVDCDGTLWAGIARAAGADSVDIGKAEWADGEIHRRPKSDDHPDCYPVESASTVSRDMLLGYTFAAWRSGDRDRLARVASYGERHKWIMGEGNLGDTLLTANLIGLYGKILDRPYKVLEPLYTKDKRPYVMHLTALYLLIRGEVYGVLTQNEADILEWLSNEDKDDLLFKTAFHVYYDGQVDDVIDSLLSDDSYIPGYVRGSDNYRYVHWLFVAKIILGRS